ncbi:MAG: amino acid ABC transporter permease [Propionivibrio sp.]
MPPWLSLMIDSFWPLLSAGVFFTIPLTLLSFVGGLSLGFLVALIRLFGPRWLVAIARFYVWLIRGTPLMVQLFIIFYGLPSVGIVLDAFVAALIGFVLSVGAYTSEVVRAAIQSVAKGQWEASYSVGMSWTQTMRRTILPLATRVAVPPLSNSFISLIKDTSLAAVLTVPEMFQISQRIAAVTYEPLVLYCEAALIYLLFSSALSVLQERLEISAARHASDSVGAR